MRTRRIGHGSVVNSANASGAWSFNAPSKHRLRQFSSNGESFDTKLCATSGDLQRAWRAADAELTSRFQSCKLRSKLGLQTALWPRF